MAIKFEYKKGDYYINGEKFHDKLELTFEQRQFFSQFQELLLNGMKIKSAIYNTKEDEIRSDNTKSEAN